MAAIPTRVVKLKDSGARAVINDSDFDETKHEAWTENKPKRKPAARKTTRKKPAADSD